LPEFFFEARDAVARGVGRDDKGADAAAAGGGVGHREDDRNIGIRAGGDELLGAVQHPAIAATLRACFQRDGIGAGLRLG
jgi:hypothetical protein